MRSREYTSKTRSTWCSLVETGCRGCKALVCDRCVISDSAFEKCSAILELSGFLWYCEINWERTLPTGVCIYVSKHVGRTITLSRAGRESLPEILNIWYRSIWRLNVWVGVDDVSYSRLLFSSSSYLQALQIWLRHPTFQYTGICKPDLKALVADVCMNLSTLAGTLL